MSFDVAASARRLKPQRATQPLARRPDARLNFVPAEPGPGPELLLDTCVYIDVLQGRTPAQVDDLLQVAPVHYRDTDIRYAGERSFGW